MNIYCEASQEVEKNSFVQNQLNRAKNKLKGKLNESELKKIASKQAEINELKKQLANLQKNKKQEQVSVQKA